MHEIHFGAHPLTTANVVVQANRHIPMTNLLARHYPIYDEVPHV